MPNTAMKVRLEKESHPERFCPVPRCLWKAVTHDGPKPCPKHMASVEVPVIDKCARCHEHTTFELIDNVWLSVCCGAGGVQVDPEPDQLNGVNL